MLMAVCENLPWKQLTRPESAWYIFDRMELCLKSIPVWWQLQQWKTVGTCHSCYADDLWWKSLLETAHMPGNLWIHFWPWGTMRWIYAGLLQVKTGEIVGICHSCAVQDFLWKSQLEAIEISGNRWRYFWPVETVSTIDADFLTVIAVEIAWTGYWCESYAVLWILQLKTRQISWDRWTDLWPGAIMSNMYAGFI